MSVVFRTTGVVDGTTPRPLTSPEPASYDRLLAAARELVACDAIALLRLDDAVLTPVAVDGLSVETLGRRFVVAAHPRLARLAQSAGALRFAPDCGLPDPYDGLVAGQPAILPVHDCLGAPLRIGGRLWGLLTLDALQPGAFDAVGDAQLDALVRLVSSGVEAIESQHSVARHDAQAQAVAREWHAVHAPPRELVGTSAPMQRLREEIDAVAASGLTVLVLGETGVGKDLVAQRLHAASGRSGRALVQVNCAALPETIADSELFGHKRGAFTGAVQDRLGKFELAHGGTLFLDEVGELPLSIQAKLLRVLQSGELQRPGSDRVQKVDVRIVAATNRDLPALIAQGRFRADLYHRLAVYPLLVPPLRERGRDVLTLAGGFLEENQHRLGARNLRLSPAAKSALLAHDWPGNVRELEHVLGRAALRAFHEQGRSGRWIAIEPRHVALDGSAPNPAAQPAPAPPAATQAASVSTPGQTLADATQDFQRRWLQACIARHGGHLSRAAAEAGMDRSNFHRLARKLGVLTPRTAQG